jgi:hypothetical protein
MPLFPRLTFLSLELIACAVIFACFSLPFALERAPHFTLLSGGVDNSSGMFAFVQLKQRANHRQG